MALWEDLLKSVKSAVNLKIVTYVGDVELTGDVCNPNVTISAGNQQSIVTCMDLVDGDITTCFPDEFKGDDQNWIRSYHDEQVKLGRQVVEHNLKLVMEIGEKLVKAITEVKNLEKS